MAPALNIWTPLSIRSFHNSVAKLYKLTQIPSEARYYRDSTTSNPDGHVLSLIDELQMADNIAFLAHYEEDVHKISAVTLVEQPSGLTVVLASNSTPSQSIIAGLRDIFAKICQYSVLRKGRQQYCRSLFLEVLQLSQARILGRIRPPWVQQPSHIKTPRPFLKGLIMDFAEQLKKRLRSAPQLQVIYDQICELIDSLQPLHQRLEHDEMNKVLESVIMKCAAVATIGNRRSFVEHLKSLGMPFIPCDTPEVWQIDKLARYLFLCKDFLRLARKPDYSVLFNHIAVIPLEAYPGRFRAGLSRECFVHAEMQQILYHEKQTHRPAVRAIGCSKSACYLCDLFILKQGRYRLSQTHGRLYHQWTIPDVDWMTEAQVTSFRAVIQDMIRHLDGAIRSRQTGTMPRMPYPLESRAFLPLSSGSTASENTAAMLSSCISSPAFPGSDLVSAPSNHQTPSVILTSADLPFQSNLTTGQIPLDIQIDQLHLSFEFVSVSAGRLSVRHTKPQDISSKQVMTVEASTIPTDDEMKVMCDPKTSQVRFQLQHGPQLSIEVGFLWGQIG